MYCKLKFTMNGRDFIFDNNEKWVKLIEIGAVAALTNTVLFWDHEKFNPCLATWLKYVLQLNRFMSWMENNTIFSYSFWKHVAITFVSLELSRMKFSHLHSIILVGKWYWNHVPKLKRNKKWKNYFKKMCLHLTFEQIFCWRHDTLYVAAFVKFSFN